MLTRAVVFIGLLAMAFQPAEALPIRAVKGGLALAKKNFGVIRGVSGKKLDEMFSALQDGKVQLVIAGKGKEIEVSYQDQQLFIRQLETYSDGVMTRGAKIAVEADLADCRQPFRCLAIAEENISNHLLALLDNKTVTMKSPLDYQLEFKLDDGILNQRAVSDEIVGQWQPADIDAYGLINDSIEDPQQRPAVINAVEKIFKPLKEPESTPEVITNIEQPQVVIDVAQKNANTSGQQQLFDKLFLDGPAVSKDTDRRRRISEILGIAEEDYLKIAQNFIDSQPSDHKAISTRFRLRFKRTSWPDKSFPEEQAAFHEMLLEKLEKASLDDASRDLLAKELDELFSVNKSSKVTDQQLVDDLTDNLSFQDKSTSEKLKIIANYFPDRPWSWQAIGDDRIVTQSFASYYLRNATDIDSLVDFYHPDFHKNFSELLKKHKDIMNTHSGNAQVERLGRFNKDLKKDHGINEIKLVNGYRDTNGKKIDVVYQFSYGSKLNEGYRHHRIYFQQLSIDDQHYFVFLSGFKKEYHVRPTRKQVDLVNHQQDKAISDAKKLYSIIKKDVKNKKHRIFKE